MFENKVKNNDFNLFVNKLFCLKYIEKFIELIYKVDFYGIMVNGY